MKQFFTILLTFLCMGVFAQLPVSQVPEKKKAVIEEFNGIHCGFCPDGHRISNNIYNSDPDNVIIINVHTGSLSSPSAGELDFRTSYGPSLASQSGLTGYPSATINRHNFGAIGTSTALSRGQWANAVNIIKTQDAYANVALEADIDVQTMEMTVNVEVYYTADAPVSSNYLNVVFTQGNILDNQYGMGENPSQVDYDEELYIHKHALREMITGQWGEEITTVSEGTLVEKTYTYTLPETFRNIPVDLVELEVVAFVSETTQEIINGNKYHATVSNFLNDVDGKIESAKVYEVDCTERVAPVIKVRNNGGNDITTMEIEYTINEGNTETYNFSGNIKPGYVETITLPDVAYNKEGNSNSVVANIKTVNGQSDADATNNSKTSQSFKDVKNYSTSDFKLKLWTDQWATETSWRVLDEFGGVLYSSSPYPDLGGSGTTEREFDFNLPQGKCYYFEILDSYGDGICSGSGNGKFEFYANDEVILSGCNFRLNESIYFTNNQVNFTIDKSFASETHDTDEGDPTVHNVLTPSVVPLTLKWHLTDLNVPAGWTEMVAVCDAIECHVETLTSYEYTIDATGGTPLDVHFINNGLTGVGEATLVVYEVGDSANSRQEIDYEVTILQATGVFDNNTRKVNVYPNPATYNLSIEGLSSVDVDQINVYNVLGDEVLKVPFVNQEINTIDITSLENGIYFIKMYDKIKDEFLSQSFIKQ